MIEKEQISSLKIYTLAEDYSGYDSPFWAQFGISFLLEITENSNTKRILFDTGSYSEPLFFNAKKLKIDLTNIDMIVISHNHFDHTGGLLEVIKRIDHEIPIFAHPDIFRKSYAVEPNFFYVGVPQVGDGFKVEIERIGGKWIFKRNAFQLTSGVYYLGEIDEREKENFERSPSINLVQLDKTGKFIPDTVKDEISLSIMTPKGLVVIAACAHTGMISIIQKAMRVTNTSKVHSVVGGLHLLHSSTQRINKTINAFERLNVKRVITGHCTGLQAEATLEKRFKSNFEKLHSGKIITF